MGDDIRLHRRIELPCRFERNRARQDAPIHLRQGDIHGQIPRQQSLLGRLPDRLRRAGKNHLQNHVAALVEHGWLAFRARRGNGKAGRVQHNVRRAIFENTIHHGSREPVLEAGDEEGQRIDAFRLQTRNQSLNRLGLATLHQRTIEDNCRNGRILDPAAADEIERNHRLARPPKTRFQQRGCFGWLFAAVDQRSTIIEEGAHIGSAALDQIVPQRVTVGARNCREPIQPVVGLVVAGKHCNLDAIVHGAGMKRFQPIGPISLAADNANDNQLCMTRRPFDISINRHGMGEAQKTGKPQAWPAGIGAMHLRKTGELRIRSGKEQNIARRLAEIDGLIAVADRSFLGKQKMHYKTASFTALVIASSSISCRPMTTRRVERASSLPHGRSK